MGIPRIERLSMGESSNTVKLDIFSLSIFLKQSPQKIELAHDFK